MTDRRLLILPAELVEKIDANRGEMGRAEFLRFLLEHALQEGQEKGAPPGHVTRQEFEAFKQDMRSLLRSFLDFFITYGLELGASPKQGDFHLLEEKLREAVEQPKPHQPGAKSALG